MNEWIEFNIHDAATMRVARDAPTAALLTEMFRPFLATGLDHFDLTVTGHLEPVEAASYGSNLYRYTETTLYITGAKVQIIRDDQGFRLNGTSELLVTVLPLLDRILVERGVATIHAATVAYRGHGVCLPAWGETGKTSTIAKLMKRDGFSFMGDDWAFLARDGCLLGYPKPMFIKPHHRPIYPHLFKDKPKPLVPSALSSPLGSLATAVHPMITRHPRLAGFTRKWSPEHMMVTPRQAFPHATFSTAASLGIALFVERCDGASAVVQEKDEAWMVSRIIGNFHAEMPRQSQEVVTALGATGLVSLEDTFAQKATILAQALAGTPTFLLRVPRALSPDEASDTIVGHLQDALAAASIS